MNINQISVDNNFSGMTLDQEQSKVWEKLQAISEKMIKQKKQWVYFHKRKIQGLYIWGPAGRGKSMLVNKFYNSLTIKRKMRIHFQHFMKDIHEKLFEFNGSANPIEMLASYFAHRYDIICLDELFIEDIADASIIGNLIKALYNKNIIFVITTNIEPDKLYKNSLYKERLLKAINLLKWNNCIFNLDNQQDYRLLHEQYHDVFFWGDHKATDAKLCQFYSKKSNHEMPKSGELMVNNRQIIFKARCKHVIWFDFIELCEKPHSKLDYISLTDQFSIILISDIPQLDDGLMKDRQYAVFCNDRTRRFISLIDELYDRSILLAASFECDLSSLYLGAEFKFQFERTYSRLFEMQSHAYLKNINHILNDFNNK